MPGPERPVAQHRRRHDVPAGRLATPRTPRPRGRPACRPGSPTAAARPRPACRRRPRRRRRRSTAQYSVAFDASTSRPSTLERRRRASSVSASSTVEARRPAVSSSGPVTAQRSAAVAVLPRADVPLRVERAAAERARRPAGRDDRARRASANARAPGRRRAAPAASSGPSSSSSSRASVLARPRRPRLGGLRLDDDHARRRRPRPAPSRRPGTPRRSAASSGARSSSCGGATAGTARSPPRAPQHLVEQLARRARPAPPPAASPARPTLIARAAARPAGRRCAAPGSPTVPATKRSGGSKTKTWRGMMHEPTALPGVARPGAAAPAPPPTVGVASSPCGRRRFASSAGSEAATVAADVVRAARTNGPQRRCSGRPRPSTGRPTIRWNWSRCSPSASASDRLDHVAVADTPPRSASGAEPRVPVAHGVDRPRLHRRAATRRPGSVAARRVGLHDLPQRVLGQVLERLARSSRRSAHSPSRSSTCSRGRRRGRPAAAAAVSPAALERAGDDRGQRDAAQPLRQRLRPGPRPSRRGATPGRPAGEGAGGVGGGPAVPDEDHGGHVRNLRPVGERTGADQHGLVIVDCALYRDGHARRGDPQPRHGSAAEARRRRRRLRLDRAATSRPRPTCSASPGVFGLHPLAVEDAVSAHQRPKLERYDDSLFVVLQARSAYVDATVATSRPARSRSSSGDGLRRHRPARRRARSSTSVRHAARGRSPTCSTHGPAAVLYARRATRSSTTTSTWPTSCRPTSTRSRRSVFCPDAHRRLRAHLQAQARGAGVPPRRAAAARADDASSPTGRRAARARRRPRPFFRDVPTTSLRVVGAASSRSTGCCHGILQAPPRPGRAAAERGHAQDLGLGRRSPPCRP